MNEKAVKMTDEGAIRSKLCFRSLNWLVVRSDTEVVERGLEIIGLAGLPTLAI